MSTLKGTTMHPRCRHIGACWDLLECWFKLFSTSQNTSQIQFRTLKKKSNFLVLISCCSTREDLSVDVSISYSCRTDIDEARAIFSAYWNSGYGQNSISSISNFLENFHISGFPWCSTREDLSVDVSISYSCRTDIDEARAISFLGIRKLGERTEFNFVNFEFF